MPNIIHTRLREAMREHPDATVGTLKQSRTYAQLLDDARIKARVLDDVLPRGSRILVVARNYPGYMSTVLALWDRGDLPVLADPAVVEHELEPLVDGCGIDAVIGDADLAERAGPGDPVAVDERTVLAITGRTGERPALAPDTELARLTSGSTRTPACIEFSGSAVLDAARTWIAASGLSAGDRCLCFAGIYNGLAFNTTLIPGLLVGADLVLPSVLPTGGAILRHIAAARPTVLTAFPAAYERVTAFADDEIAPVAREALSGIRLRLSSAAPLPPAVHARIAELSGPICDYYGLAETGPVTFNAEGAGGTHGRPLPGVTVRVAERERDGASVLHVRTASMGTRYLNYPGEFEKSLASDGSYITSDSGEIVDGALRLGERVVPTLNIGGRKFGPDTVRAPIVAYPGVEDCAVVQLTTPSGRDCVGAAVVTSGDLDLAALERHLRGVLADFTIPEVIRIVAELPTGSTGKVKTTAVRALLTASFTQKSGSDS